MGIRVGLVEEVRPDVLDLRSFVMSEEEKKEDESGFCFIPDKVSVGLFSSNASLRHAKLNSRLFREPKSGEFGFVTCRFKYGQWVSLGVFERLTGYKPSMQRDSAVQLTKEVSGTVQELDNAPVEGFRIASWMSNPYGFCTKEYSCTGDVVLEDPRGFMVAVKTDSFFRALTLAGGNVREGSLLGKYAYGWRCADKMLTLVPAVAAEFEKWKKWSDRCRVKEKTAAGIRKGDLVQGRVYRGTGVMTGDWMYVGKMDTYSQDCHMDAFDNGGRYDVDRFLKHEASHFRCRGYASWPTTKGRLVFRSMKQQAQQYVTRADIRGVLLDELKPGPDGSYCDSGGRPYAFEDGKNVTYERVMEDVGSSPAFHKIVFSDNVERLPIPVELTKYDYGYLDRMPYSFFPFVYRLNARMTLSKDEHWNKVTFAGPLREDGTKSFRLHRNLEASVGNVSAASYRTTPDDLRKMTLQELYDSVMPTYPAYRLDNGKQLKPEFAVMFVPSSIRDCSANLF